jgi:hypothetical protein
MALVGRQFALSLSSEKPGHATIISDLRIVLRHVRKLRPKRVFNSASEDTLVTSKIRQIWCSGCRDPTVAHNGPYHFEWVGVWPPLRLDS